ncbi:hypothetical protein JX265_002694 [Neoarthrinium moseri]|uniref:DUF3669 domain-containing protein n=1 Tax=Neoarthrinium moseri TaxID=1658444 RepID=A0A9P9WUX1_9PEZI|nr:hypothetical protein JX265_002694 [Neoarthrinium moseri]
MDSLQNQRTASASEAKKVLAKYLSTGDDGVLNENKHHVVDQQVDVGYEHIGEGLCAAVFNFGGNGNVIKHGWAGKESQLRTDFEFHQPMYQNVNSKHSIVAVPKPQEFVGQSKAPDALEALIEEFCLQTEREATRKDSRNNPCLLRLYLGVRRPNFKNEDEFSLRNFEPTFDKVEHPDIDAKPLARKMARALAACHWECRCDAFDVEFVYGAPRGDQQGLEERAEVWLFDFNQCGKTTLDEAGVERAVRGFWDDPYYPRPGATARTAEHELWQSFRDAYLAESEEILEEIDVHLAKARQAHPCK